MNKKYLTTMQCFGILCIERRGIAFCFTERGENMNIKKELTKGSSALLVLSVLEKGDMYGYRIIKEIEMRSEFVFSLKEGTLYPILHAFEKDGSVESYWEGKEGERRRKYYHLTEKGKEYQQKLKDEWIEFVSVVEEMIG